MGGRRGRIAGKNVTLIANHSVRRRYAEENIPPGIEAAADVDVERICPDFKRG